MDQENSIHTPCTKLTETYTYCKGVCRNTQLQKLKPMDTFFSSIKNSFSFKSLEKSDCFFLRNAKLSIWSVALQVKKTLQKAEKLQNLHVFCKFHMHPLFFFFFGLSLKITNENVNRLIICYYLWTSYPNLKSYMSFMSFV